MIYGVGVDMASISRTQLAVERSGKHFLNRFFTDREIEYCQIKKDPYPRFAMVFAGKESVLKGYGKGWNFTGWKNIEIVLWDKDKPKIVLYKIMDEEKKKNGITHMHISVSCTDEYAVAMSVMEAR